MYIVLLRFADQRARARDFMEAHNAWLRSGFAEGAFLLAGSIEPAAGGAILAQGCTRAELEARVAADPFVAESVVRAEIIQVSPARVDERLAFLAA